MTYYFNKTITSPYEAAIEKVKAALRLAAVDARAEALGLHPGLALADARARYPGLRVEPHDPPAAGCD